MCKKVSLIKDTEEPKTNNVIVLFKKNRYKAEIGSPNTTITIYMKNKLYYLHYYKRYCVKVKYN